MINYELELGRIEKRWLAYLASEELVDFGELEAIL